MKIQVTVPIRGTVLSVDAKGSPRADNSDGVEPIDIERIAIGLVGPNSRAIRSEILDLDLEAGTALIELDCADTAWLSAVETAINNVDDLRVAEADIFDAIIDGSEKYPTTGEKTVAKALFRARSNKGLIIAQRVLDQWKAARSN